MPIIQNLSNVKATTFSLKEASANPYAPSNLWQEKQAEFYVYNSELLNVKLWNTVSKYCGREAPGQLKHVSPFRLQKTTRSFINL